MNKIAIVTGANRGLGAGLTKILSQNGYKVYAAMRTVGRFSATASNIVPIELDVSDDESIKHLAGTLKSNNERVALLINNAGLNKDTVAAGHKEAVTKLDKLDRTALLTMFDVNTIAPFMLTKLLLPLMAADGLIVNISSNRGSFHDENESSSANYGYRASKAALNIMTLAATQDLPDGVSIVAVHPGSVLTDMNPRGTTTPAEAAALIYEHIIVDWNPEKTGAFLKTNGEAYPY